jgi:flagellar assembly protein FliH
MPSSPDITILPGDAIATGAATVTSWQLVSLSGNATAAVTAFTLPRFERKEQASSPTLRAFAVSRKAGIPEDLLAAESAAARASGYAAGYATGIDEARAATRARLAAEAAAAETAANARESASRQAFQALFDAAEELEGLAVQSAADIQEQIVSAAWSIAEAIVGQVLAEDETRSRAALTRALALAPSDEDVTVTVSPADFMVLAGRDGADADDFDSADVATDMTPLRRSRGLRSLVIMADEALAPGDAVASCGATTIDARLTAAIERVRQVLAQ